MIEWRCVWRGDEPHAQAEPGARSSHGITADAGSVFLFGGERVARVPVDNAVYRLNLKARTYSLRARASPTLAHAEHMGSLSAHPPLILYGP